jgi:ABC-type iron transport system FetAB permease component
MSVIEANVVIPVNGAVAANVLSEDSLAEAQAEQDVETEQTNDERGTS